MNYFYKRLNAIRIATIGILQAFKREIHLKLHFVIASFVVSMAFFFEVSKTDWYFLLLAITLVISFEMINSATEKLCDFIKTEQDPKIKYIKDVAAGAVLIVCVFALIIGICVFAPYFKAIW